jgi:hypothetical protein
MKQVIVAAALLFSVSSALAQTAPQADTNQNTPAVTTPESINPDAPVEGANSFTEDQAKTRMEEAGFSNVANLNKAENGIWMASGMKDGSAVSISLDYQGNVVSK